VAICLFHLCEEQRDEAISFLKRETAATLCQPNLSHYLKLNGKGSRCDDLKCLCEERSDVAICLFRLCEERSDVAIRLFLSLQGAKR